MLVELILALCAHASGSPATAVQHADGAFVFAAAGAFRSCALLFIRLLDDDARRAYQAKALWLTRSILVAHIVGWL